MLEKVKKMSRTSWKSNLVLVFHVDFQIKLSIMHLLKGNYKYLHNIHRRNRYIYALLVNYLHERRAFEVYSFMYCWLNETWKLILVMNATVMTAENGWTKDRVLLSLCKEKHEWMMNVHVNLFVYFALQEQKIYWVFEPYAAPKKERMSSRHQFHLRWSNYGHNLANSFIKLFESESLADVTLFCDGKSNQVKSAFCIVSISSLPVIVI